jgi:hypothetical protein
VNAKVEGLAQLEYLDQRHVMSSLSVGSLEANGNDVRAVKNPKHLFRGKVCIECQLA